MKPECNDLVIYRQLHFSFLWIKKDLLRAVTVYSVQLHCTKGLDTIDSRGPIWSQGDGHKTWRRILPIDELLALMLRATANQPVCGENKAL